MHLEVLARVLTLTPAGHHARGSRIVTAFCLPCPLPLPSAWRHGDLLSVVTTGTTTPPRHHATNYALDINSHFIFSVISQE